MTAFCTLCGNTEPGDLGATIGICLNAEACRRRQARMREHRQYVAEQIAREIEDIICTPEAACGDLDCRQALADAATARNLGGVPVPETPAAASSVAAALEDADALPGMPSPPPVPAGTPTAATGPAEGSEAPVIDLGYMSLAPEVQRDLEERWREAMANPGPVIVLPSEHWRERAEAAEAKLDAVYEYCQTYRRDEGMTLACEDILAIIGTDEKENHA